MTIPKLTPYTGQVANPDGSQTQSEFTTNMFNQLSYEANLATELDATIDGMNNAVDEVSQNAAIAKNSANAAEAAASSAGYQGLWPDAGGSALKGETWQTQVGGTPTGEYYTALQNTSVDPVGDNVNWKMQSDLNTENLSDYTGIDYKASGGNSAVDNMIYGHPLPVSVGDKASTGGTSWVRISDTNNNITDFKALGPVWMSDFGVATTGDNTAKINACFGVGGYIIVPDLGDDIPHSGSLIVPSNTTVIWLGSYFRLTAPSSLGAILYSSGTDDEFKENITYINPLIDGGDQGWKVGAEFGENGCSASKCRNVNIWGGHIKRCRYGTKSQTSSGGKAINYEFGVENINVNGTLIEDCSSALETSASPDGNPGEGLGVNRFSRNTNFSNITVKRCGRILRLVRAESPTLGRDDLFYGTAKNIRAIDCGIEDYETTDDSGTLDGKAAITLDRTTNWDIEIKLENSDTYGVIDAPIKQRRGYQNQVNLKFTGDCNSLVSHVNPGGNVVGTLEDNDYEVKHAGSAAHAVDRTDGDTSFNANTYRIMTDVITSSLVRTPLDGIAEFTDRDSKSIIDGDLSSIFNNGNTYDTTVHRKSTKPELLNSDYKVTSGGGGISVSSSQSVVHRAENADVFTLKDLTIVFSSLPTSPTGLDSGSLWNDAGTVKIV